MKVRPLQDRIVIKRIESETKTAGGLFIPSSAQEKQQEGEVIAVGPGRALKGGAVVPLEVKTGDRVLFSKYSGTEIKLDGQEVVLLREDDLLAVRSGN